MVKAITFLFGLLLIAAGFENRTSPVSASDVKQDSSRFSKTVLAEGLDEPMQMSILPNKDVLFVERKGGIRLYKHATKQLLSVANIDVFSGIEDGLLGLALDPDFQNNNWIYLYYAVADTAVNRLSRFIFQGDTLNRATQRTILEFGTQRKYCCHSAGYLQFDKEGNLYLSTGDNTNAEETEGYTPVDQRPGRSRSDDQATAANTNDLRGKILRIKPLAQGGYSIPKGNLFAPTTPKTRPEIYAMGMRNPYRFSIDDKTGYLYFGEVGPDTKVRGSDGELMSYDEINQVRSPGYFGWPYFLGNNQVFPHYDYQTKNPGPGKDPLRPVNESPNNTGITELPAAQPAMIWYNKSKSSKFPLVGSGGASAMAGPVYNYESFAGQSYRLPSYYDGKLFIYDWIRGWIMAVGFDQNGNYKDMEPFLSHWRFDAPIDMQFCEDGAIYILEYGSNWFSKNTNARLVRVEYMESNRSPLPAITIDKQYGSAPFAVNLSSEGTIDHDGLRGLRYLWEIEGKFSEGSKVSHVFKKNGIYPVKLTVTDPEGASAAVVKKVYVGNTAPSVSVQTKSNKTFFWDDQNLDYNIVVKDKEEQVLAQNISVAFGYIPNGKDAAIVLTQPANLTSAAFLKGQTLLGSLDCRACHSISEQSVGPSYQAIADRYKNIAGADRKLAEKIIQGGSGNWGERAMSPHPELSGQDASEIVKYILSLSKKNDVLGLKGSVPLNAHTAKGQNGVYLLRAAYTDQGANLIGPLTSADHLMLRHSVIQAEDFDSGDVSVATLTTAFMAHIAGVTNGKYIAFKNIDLHQVKKIGIKVQTSGQGGVIQIRQGSKTGPLIGLVKVSPGQAQGPQQGWEQLNVTLQQASNQSDLYFVFINEKAGQLPLFHVDYFKFYN